MKGIENMKLTKLLSMVNCNIDLVRYEDENGIHLFDFEINEIPKNCKDEIVKFDILHGAKLNILVVIEK